MPGLHMVYSGIYQYMPVHAGNGLVSLLHHHDQALTTLRFKRWLDRLCCASESKPHHCRSHQHASSSLITLVPRPANLQSPQLSSHPGASWYIWTRYGIYYYILSYRPLVWVLFFTASIFWVQMAGKEQLWKFVPIVLQGNNIFISLNRKRIQWHTCTSIAVCTLYKIIYRI
jgi:hypothetical protein